MLKTHGAYPTMITPYTKDGQVDYETAKKYVEFYYESGCRGIFAVCQSSEIFYLDAEEKIKLNKVVYDHAKKISGGEMVIVSSAHTENSIEEQAKQLCKIAESGTDALILITNRLDLNKDGDKVWLENAKKLLSLLPKDVPLGLYECPYPYKRLLTKDILNWCVDTGRFKFIKDTCCDAAVIKERLEILKGTGLELFNANCQTLLSSLRDGGSGYCGIMCNFHPKLYTWLCDNFNDERADLVQSFIGTAGFTEVGLAYPLTAKYNMDYMGIPTEIYARNRYSTELTDYAKDCVRQMKLCSNAFEKYLGL